MRDRLLALAAQHGDERVFLASLDTLEIPPNWIHTAHETDQLAAFFETLNTES